MSSTDGIIGRFEAISLEEMDAVKLMNRVDTKYVFPVSLLPGVLSDLSLPYRILETSGVRMSHYETLYYDTPEYRFYLQHHNGKLNRYKVRCREYKDSSLCFFEIKFKSNQGRTIKDRVRRSGIDGVIDGKARTLLEEKTDLSPESLSPVLRVFFTRMTLVDKSQTERMTLDTDLRYQMNGKECGFPGVVIAELKQDGRQPSLFPALMKEREVRPLRVSKYCTGIATLEPSVKRNNFKRKLILLNQMNHDNR